MKCQTCNAELTDFESTRRDANTFQYLDMCNECIAASGIATQDRFDLMGADDLDSMDCLVAVDQLK